MADNERIMLHSFTDDPSRMRTFQRTRIILEAISLIEDLMVKEGVNRYQLAKRLGWSPSAVTQFFNQDNFKLSRLADVLHALGYAVEFAVIAEADSVD